MRVSAILCCLGLSASAASALAQPAPPDTTERISVAEAGIPHQGATAFRASSNGRFVVYAAFRDLQWTDRIGLLLKDRQTGLVERIDVNDAGEPGNQNATPLSVSDDGRRVLFMSRADNLVPLPRPNHVRLFVRDRQAWTTRELWIDNPGCGVPCYFTEQATLSRAGDVAIVGWRYISDGQERRQHHWRIDIASGAVTLLSTNPAGEPAHWDTFDAGLSGNGRFLIFSGQIGNLVPGYSDIVEPDTGFPIGVVIRKDLVSGATRIVSTGPGNDLPNRSSGSAAISYDGRYVTFEGLATNIVPVDMPFDGRQIFIKDTLTGAAWLASREHTGEPAQHRGSYEPSISDDGRRVAFRSNSPTLVFEDINSSLPDVFIYDLDTPSALLVSRNSLGEQGYWYNGNLFVALLPPGSDVYRLQGSPQISADGREVLFHADSGNLAPELPPLMRTPNVFARGLPPRGDPPPPPPPAQPVPAIGFAGLLMMIGLFLAVRRSAGRRQLRGHVF